MALCLISTDSPWREPIDITISNLTADIATIPNLTVSTINGLPYSSPTIGNVEPSVSDTYNLGSVSKRWLNGYIKNTISDIITANNATITNINLSSINNVPWSPGGGVGDIIPTLNNVNKVGSADYKFLEGYFTTTNSTTINTTTLNSTTCNATTLTGQLTTSQTTLNGTSANFTQLTGTLQTASQPNITTLASCTNVSGTTFANISGTKSVFTDIIGGTIAETFPDQPNIHSIGALSATLFTQSIRPNTNDFYALGSDLYRFQNSYINTMYGLIGTAAQTNITSLGNLTGLTMAGDISALTNNAYNVGSITSYFNSGFISNLYNATLGLIIKNESTNLVIQNPLTTGDVIIRLGDTGGNTNLQIQNSTGQDLLSLYDEGTLYVRNCVPQSNLTYTLGAAGAEFTNFYSLDANISSTLKCQTFQITSLSTGILHSNASGQISSSQIVNADISASAAIANSKLAGNPSATNQANTIMLRDGSGNIETGSLSLTLNNNINFYGNKLFMYHDNTNGVIGDTTGDLFLRCNNNLRVSDSSFNTKFQIANNGVATFTGSTINNVIINNSNNSQNNIAFNNTTTLLEFGQKTSTDSYLYSSANASYIFYFDASNNPIFYNNFKPGANGSFDIGNSGARVNTLYCTNAVNVSDRNLKENITNCDLGLDFITRLTPKIYKFKDTQYDELQYDGSHITKTLPHNRLHMGLIAQDVEQVLIDIARPFDNVNVDGHKIRDLGILVRDENGYGLRYDQLIPCLIKAVQELSAKLDIVENKLLANNIGY